MNQFEIVKEILDEMLEIGGIPTNEEFYSEFNFRLKSKLGIDDKTSTINEIKLQPLFGSSYCKYSIIENQLRILYENQEKLLSAIKFNNVKS